MSPLLLGRSHNHALLIADMIPELCSIIALSNPDISLCYADRYETFAFALASFHSDLILVHLEAGDITTGGTYDDQIRHCISQMSHILYSSTPSGLQHVRKLVPESWRSYHSGLLRQPRRSSYSESYLRDLCRSLNISSNKPLLLLTVHPIPRDPDASIRTIVETLECLRDFAESDLDVIVTSPNADSGSEQIISAILSRLPTLPHVRYIESLGGERYHALLSMASSRTVIVAGNSSSVIKEAPFYSAYGLNIGSRQSGREPADTQHDVISDRHQIKNILLYMIRNKCFTSYNPYASRDPVDIVLNSLLKIVRTYSFSAIKTIAY